MAASAVSLQARRLNKRRASSPDLVTRLLVVFLAILVAIMLVANIVFLWPITNHNDDNNHIATVPSMESASMRQQQQQQRPHDDTNESHKIVEIFREAGVELNADEIRDLPSWKDIVKLVGDQPIVHGLETCQAFRDSIPPIERNLGAAGMFNTGTNLVTRLLKENCKIPERVDKYGIDASREAHGIRWQVSWGKHTPAHFKWEHATDHAKDIQKETILPVVTIRDPYHWMASMCRNGYTAKWTHGPHRCPNLRQRKRPGMVERASQPVPVNVTYAERRQSHHNSLAHLWNDWNQEYLRADYPRLVVRFEDLIFFPKEITRLICECAGGQLQLPFTYIVDPAKTGPGHGKTSERTGMVQAWIKYGKPPQRQGGFSQQDYAAAVEFLDSNVMDIFGYTHPPAT